MKALKYWAMNLAMDAVLAASFVAWKGYGIEGAGNAFVFLMWTAVVMGILAGFLANKSMFKNQRPAGFKTYHTISDIVLIVAMAWHGLFALAGFYAVAHVFLEVAREREAEPKNNSAVT